MSGCECLSRHAFASIPAGNSGTTVPLGVISIASKPSSGGTLFDICVLRGLKMLLGVCRVWGHDDRIGIYSVIRDHGVALFRLTACLFAISGPDTWPLTWPDAGDSWPVICQSRHGASKRCRTHARMVRYKPGILRHSGSDRRYSVAARHLM